MSLSSAGIRSRAPIRAAAGEGRRPADSPSRLQRAALNECVEIRTYHFGVPEYTRGLHRDAWQRLQDAVPVEARTTAEVRARVVSGTPAAEIARIASEVDADLVVVGVTSRGAIGRKLLGSTATRVIRSAGRPVLAVPEQALGWLDEDRRPDSVIRLAARQEPRSSLSVAGRDTRIAALPLARTSTIR